MKPVHHSRHDPQADLTLALLLAVCRLVPQSVHEAKTGGWGTWKPKWLCGVELAGKTVGIIGMGRIGSAVAKRLRAFEIGRLLYWGRSEKPAAADLRAEFGGVWTLQGIGNLIDQISPPKVTKEQLLRESDIVILTCALAEDTKVWVDGCVGVPIP